LHLKDILLKKIVRFEGFLTGNPPARWRSTMFTYLGSFVATHAVKNWLDCIKRTLELFVEVALLEDMRREAPLVKKH